jgi:hypothetical protein
MNSYKVLNNFALTGKTFESGVLARRTQPVKNIVVPISMSFKNNGYSDLINSIAKEEKEDNVNVVIDRETIRFRSAFENTSELSSPQIEFHFIDDNNTYGNSFINAGFEQSDIDGHTNRLTKSFFRLDFYDSPNEKEQNFLFSEFLNVNLSSTPIFPLNRIFWLKHDPKFIDDNTYRDLFIEALFFNSKDGTVRRFINRGIVSIITLNEYKNNPSWRFTRIKVLNPYTDTNTTVSNNNKLFYIYNGINDNTDTQIKFVEVKIT